MNIWEIPFGFILIAMVVWLVTSVIFLMRSELIGAAILTMFFFTQLFLDLFFGGKHIPNGQIILATFGPLLLISYFFQQQTRARLADLLPLMLLAFAIMASIIWNELPMWQNKSQVLPVVFAILIYISIPGPREARNLVAIFAFFVTLSSVIGGLQYAGFENMYLPSQLAQVDAGGRRRGVGLANHFTQTGMYCAAVIPMCLAAVINTKRTVLRILWGTAVVAATAGVMFTTMRAGLGGALIGSLFVLFFGARRYIIPLALAGVFAVAVMVFAIPTIREAGTSLVEHTITVDDSARIRPKLVEMGIEMWSQSPIFGKGPASLARVYGPGDAHNTYVNLLSDFGLIGLFAFLYALIVAARRLKRATRLRPDERLLYIGIGGALISTCVVGIVHTLHYLEEFWLIPALALAAGRLPGRAPAAADPPLLRAKPLLQFNSAARSHNSRP